MPLLCENRTANPRQTPSAKLVATKTPCRYCLHSSLLPLFHPRTQKPHSRFLARRRRPVRAYSRYDQGTTRRSHSSPIPKEISSAVHSLSFNQQLLVVLCIPAAAVGIPFALSHPLLCIVLPLVVYYTPGLQEVVKPLLLALLQSILSGLRPAGSPKSRSFPWQQANQNPYSCPPIDVEYQALPGEMSESAYSHAQSPTVARNEYTRPEQPSTSYQSTQPDVRSRQRVSINSQSRSEPAGTVQNRRRVSIRPSQRQSMRNGRIVRQAAPGRVGVNIGPASSTVSEPNSNIVRALLGAFPFLRHWGGFL